MAQNAKWVFIFSAVSSAGIVLIRQNVSIAGIVINLSCTGRTQSSRGHNKALHYANPSASHDGIATDVLQPTRSLPDIIALQAFSILKVCVKGTLVSFKKGIQWKCKFVNEESCCSTHVYILAKMMWGGPALAQQICWKRMTFYQWGCHCFITLCNDQFPKGIYWLFQGLIFGHLTANDCELSNYRCLALFKWFRSYENFS